MDASTARRPRPLHSPLSALMHQVLLSRKLTSPLLSPPKLTIASTPLMAAVSLYLSIYLSLLETRRKFDLVYGKIASLKSVLSLGLGKFFSELLYVDIHVLRFGEIDL